MAHNESLDSRQRFSYKMQLSYLNEHSARCDSAIGWCLSLNNRIMFVLSYMRKNADVFCNLEPVHLHLQNNAHFLLDPQQLCLNFDLDAPENSDIVKQRSNKWLELRKKAKVTGSTLYNALGLSSLADLKQHHYQYIKKRAPPPFSPDVQKRLQYGQENEKNAIAALVGSFLPSLLPNCFSFLEVGPKFLRVYGEENFLEVSPDGILRCMRDEGCCYKNLPEHSTLIPVEAKCVYPDPTKPLEPMYQLIQRHVPQTLSKMAIYSVVQLWLIVFTRISTVLIKVCFDEALWLRMLWIASELHGGDKPKVPTKLHPETKSLKEDVCTFIRTCCTFLCEIPSLFGVEGALRQSEILSPYSICDTRDECTVDINMIERKCATICLEAKPLFKDIHNTLHQEAQEVLVFMLSDHNRHHEEFIPYSLPLGYAMKGKNLSNNELRHLIDHCRDTLKNRSIPVLTEVYDGQWQNLCMTDKHGNPLNALRLIKPMWQRVQKMSKQKCIQELALGSKLKKRDLEQMEKSEHLEIGKTNYYNLEISRIGDASLDVKSTGGMTFKSPAIQYIRSITKRSRPDMWEEVEINRLSVDDETLNDAVPTQATKKKITGLSEEEQEYCSLIGQRSHSIASRRNRRAAFH